MQQKYVKVVRGGDIAKLFVGFQQCIASIAVGMVCVCVVFSGRDQLEALHQNCHCLFTLVNACAEKLEGVF